MVILHLVDNWIKSLKNKKMPTTLPVGGLTVASLTLTAIVVGNAYYQKKQFYPSVVYITKSNPSLAVSIILVLISLPIVNKILKKMC